MEKMERNWHVDTGASRFEVDSETVIQWIRDGSVLSHHRISREGTRWLEAGKVPQFASHFAAQPVMADARANRFDRPPIRDENGYRVEKPVGSPPTGLRIAAGTVFALIIAAVAGYAWAYHISAKRSAAEMQTEPAMAALQEKYDKEKRGYQEIASGLSTQSVADARPTPAPVSKLGPAKTGDIAERKIKFGNGVVIDRDSMPEFNMPPPPPDVKMPGMGPFFPSGESRMQQLDQKFEADKKQLTAEIHAADSKRKFLPVFLFAFLGLGGLNIARISLSNKK